MSPAPTLSRNSSSKSNKTAFAKASTLSASIQLRLGYGTCIEKTWALAERQRNLVDTDSDDGSISQEAVMLVNKQGQSRLPLQKRKLT